MGFLDDIGGRVLSEENAKGKLSWAMSLKVD